VNLIPLEYRLKLKYQRNKERGIVLSVIILAIMTGFSIYNYKIILSYQDKIIVLNNRLDSLRPVIAKNKLLEEEKLKLKSKEKLISWLSEGVSYQQILIDLNLLVPKGVVLNEFIINENKELQVGAEGINNIKVIEMINRMGNYHYFHKVSLNYTETAEDKVTFRIEGRLRL
jgi:hypothetical protein